MGHNHRPGRDQGENRGLPREGAQGGAPLLLSLLLLLPLLPLLPLPRFASLRFARGAATPPNPLAVAP